MSQSTLEIAASWLAVGLDIDRVVFYRQSDVPEIMELAWILSTVTAKGLMNRAHAYKAAVAENAASDNQDPDKGITMGLFCYPILMTADILMFKANKVPVGSDQKQHVEMARDIAERFNHHFGEIFVLPEAGHRRQHGNAAGPRRAEDVEELRQHDPAIRARESAAQAHHAHQDELARARRAQEPRRKRAVRDLSRVRNSGRGAARCANATRTASPGAR